MLIDEKSTIIYLKTYRVEGEVLVAACDCEILGETFDEGDFCLEVNVDFFGEEGASARDLEAALEEATIANVVGEKAVACAIELEWVDGDNVLHIGGVPCAQMVRM